jgi:hypothetical protein
MVMQQAGTSKASLASLQSNVSSRLDGADAAAKAAEERLQLVVDELNHEVEQVLAVLFCSFDFFLNPSGCACWRILPSFLRKVLSSLCSDKVKAM